MPPTWHMPSMVLMDTLPISASMEMALRDGPGMSGIVAAIFTALPAAICALPPDVTP